MPKYIVNVDLDSPREEGEHIEKKFKKGIEAPDEHTAELVVDKFIKDQMYGGPYYSIEEAKDEDDVPKWRYRNNKDGFMGSENRILEKEDKPEDGKTYALTGGPGARCIANGYSWKESVVEEDK